MALVALRTEAISTQMAATALQLMVVYNSWLHQSTIHYRELLIDAASCCRVVCISKGLFETTEKKTWDKLKRIKVI